MSPWGDGDAGVQNELPHRAWFWAAKCAGTGAQSNAPIHPFYVWLDAEGYVTGPNYTLVSGPFSSVWTTANATITAPADAAYLLFQLSEGTTGIDAWFDDVSLTLIVP